MSRFDDLAGSPVVDPRRAEALVRRATIRAQRLAETGALPTGGIYGDIAALQESAGERAELAGRISEALRTRDMARASRLIEVGRSTFGLAAMAAAVENQAREGRLAALKAQQDQWADQWPYDEDPAPAYLDDEEWFDGSR